jgi:hypothetical protein
MRDPDRIDGFRRLTQQPLAIAKRYPAYSPAEERQFAESSVTFSGPLACLQGLQTAAAGGR